MLKKFPGKEANPPAKPIPHRPEDMESMDSRDGHGLSEDEALKAKK